MQKLIRITTIPISLDKLLDGQLRFMNNYFQVTAVSSDPQYLEKIKVKEGVEVYNVEMTRKITPVRDLIAIWRFYKYLKKEKPLIVHSHTPKAGLVGMLASKLAGVPCRLHTVAGLPLIEAKGLKRKILMQVEKLIYKTATKVYSNSYGLSDFILGNNLLPKEKLKIIGNGSSNGINTNYFCLEAVEESLTFELKDKLNIDPTDFVFIFVGRLVKDKGVNELLAAFKKLSEESINTKLLLVGPFEQELDPLSTESLTLISENKNIISVGYKKDVRPYFFISDCLVFPSYREGFPNVVMQAGAMELPAIVSDINGCNEIIENGKNGIIVEPKNIESLVKAMKIMIEDKAFYQKMKSNARQKIVDNYQREFVWNEILLEYQNCLKAQ
ncbi:glycosyltransferase family 4 protein [Cloacibacterium normanense]|uniref:glycosyltransferase family 4 protein n=1 Tax=Cloacibacterium normanense TaxID=237258 RepID=UPI0035B04271